MTAFYDGTFTTGKQDGPRRPAYPFANYAAPDKYAVVYDRDMVVHPVSGYAPSQATRTTYTNYLKASEAFDDTGAWTATAVTFGADALANPRNGALTTDAPSETTANSEHKLDQAYTFTAVSHTFSVYARAGLRSWIRLQIYDGTNTRYAFFNLSTGAAGTTSASTTAAITDAGNSFYRCSITTTTAAGAGYVYLNASTDGSTVSYVGTAATAFYLYGAQLERSTYAGAYVVTTSASASISAPNIESLETLDGTDAFAYLVNESPLSVSGGVGTFQRRYARIPSDQIIPSSAYFNRPVMHDIVSGTSFAVSFDEGVTSHVWSSRKTVSALSAPAATYLNLGNQQVSLAHQQVTVQLNNSSQSFYLDDTDTTIKNALSTAFVGTTANAANFYLSRWKYGLYISWAGISATIAAITVTTTDIEISSRTSALGTATSTGAIEFVSAQTYLSSVRTITSTAHGAAAGNQVAIWNGNKLVAMSRIVSALTDSFTFKTSDLPDGDAVATHCAFDKDGTRYVNGPKVCTLKRTQKFYLPGISSGITTFADIPDQTVYTDPISWLGRIIAVPTGYACVAVSDLTQWDGPILMQEIAEVQMSDAIDTTTAAG